MKGTCSGRPSRPVPPAPSFGRLISKINNRSIKKNRRYLYVMSINFTRVLCHVQHCPAERVADGVRASLDQVAQHSLSPKRKQLNFPSFFKKSNDFKSTLMLSSPSLQWKLEPGLSAFSSICFRYRSVKSRGSSSYSLNEQRVTSHKKNR